MTIQANWYGPRNSMVGALAVKRTTLTIPVTATLQQNYVIYNPGEGPTVPSAFSLTFLSDGSTTNTPDAFSLKQTLTGGGAGALTLSMLYAVAPGVGNIVAVLTEGV